MRWLECSVSAYQEPPSPRMGHIAVLVDARASWGEELLVVHGGLNSEKQPLGDLVVLQTASGAWFKPSTANTGPPARAFHCAAAQGSCLYVFGGHIFVKESKGLQKFNDLWCLNTDNWEWNVVELQPDSVPPSPRDFLGMVALPCQRLLIFGGLDQAEKRLDDTWIFDCKTRTWSELALPLSKPKPRYAHAITRVDQRILLCGGETNTGVMNDMWILKGVVTPDDEKPSWLPLELPGPAPSPRKAHAIAALGWHVLVMGGHASEIGWFRTKTEIYHNDVALMERQGTVQWRSAGIEGEQPAPREYHTLTPVSSTRLLLFGGGNGKVIFSDSWWLISDAESGRQTPTAAAPLAQGSTLMGQARRPLMSGADTFGAADRASSAMSEISMEAADRTLLSSAELAQAREGKVAKNDREPSLSLPDQGVSSPLSSESALVKRVASLRRTLQISQQPVSLALEAQEQGMFQRLGRQVWQAQQGKETSPEADADEEYLRTAARTHLYSTATEELRMQDICALLWDYKQSSRPPLQLQPASLSALGQAWEGLRESRDRSFCHMQARDLRMADVAPLHAEYKSLLGKLGLT